MIKQNLASSLLSAATLVAFCAAQPALAQDDSSSSGGDDDTAETVLLLSALGLAAPDGKTELDDAAGELESHMILAPMLDNFGSDLAQAIISSEAVKNGDSVLLVAGDDNISLSKLTLVESWLSIIEARLQAGGPLCPTVVDNGIFGIMGDGAEGAGDGDRRIDTSPIALAQTVADLLQSETKVTGVDLEPSEQLLINAVSSTKLSWSDSDEGNAQAPTQSASWVVPGDIVYVGSNSIIDRYLAAVSALGQMSNQDCAKEDGSPAKAFVASITEALEALSKPGADGAPSLLEEAILLQPLRPAAPENLKVLQLSIENAGGTIEQRSNIFTTLGVSSGIRISGGMVGSYRLTSGATGAVLTSGTFFCRAPIRSFGDTHRPREDEAGGCTVN